FFRRLWPLTAAPKDQTRILVHVVKRRRIRRAATRAVAGVPSDSHRDAVLIRFASSFNPKVDDGSVAVAVSHISIAVTITGFCGESVSAARIRNDSCTRQHPRSPQEATSHR